jgi:type I restriction enzyme M protein
LFGSSKAHKELRQILVESHKLDAVIKLPSGVFRPYSSVSTAILLFTKTNSGGTDHVWFYDLEADGWSLDDKRQPLLPEAKLGAIPIEPFTDGEHARNNLPDVLMRWKERNDKERGRPRTAQSFSVPKVDIQAQNYNLSFNYYKDVSNKEVEHISPKQLLAELTQIEDEIYQGLENLKEMVK